MATALVAMVLQPCDSNNDNHVNDDILAPLVVATSPGMGRQKNNANFDTDNNCDCHTRKRPKGGIDNHCNNYGDDDTCKDEDHEDSNDGDRQQCSPRGLEASFSHTNCHRGYVEDKRETFPLQLTWILTVLIAQGQIMLGPIVLQLDDKEKEHRLAYVAFS